MTDRDLVPSDAESPLLHSWRVFLVCLKSVHVAGSPDTRPPERSVAPIAACREQKAAAVMNITNAGGSSKFTGVGAMADDMYVCTIGSWVGQQVTIPTPMYSHTRTADPLTSHSSHAGYRCRDVIRSSRPSHGTSGVPSCDVQNS